MRPVEIKYQPERSVTFLGSPSIARLPDGALLVTHDYFGNGCPRNHEDEESLTSVYRSEDDGATWRNVTHLMNAYWSSLFVHGGAVYLLGVSQQYGSIVIRRSDDGGFRWTHPKDAGSGLLFPGGPFREAPNYHCAPVAVTEHEGRIYKAFEDCDPCVWGTGFRSCVISAPVGADLLRADSWRMSNKLPFTPAWTPAVWGAVTQPGWREGNVAAAPDGQLWNVLTFEARPLAQDTAAMVRIDDAGARVSFDPGANPDPASPGGAGGFIPFPGAKAKFTLRRDPVTGVYLTLANAVIDPDRLIAHWQATQPPGEGLNKLPRQRNEAWLCASDDLVRWRTVKRLLYDDSGLRPEDSRRLTGFQYVDWQIDGDDLIYVVRTAFRGARNFHDSNRVLFCREPAFRALLAAGGRAAD